MKWIELATTGKGLYITVSLAFLLCCLLGLKLLFDIRQELQTIRKTISQQQKP